MNNQLEKIKRYVLIGGDVFVLYLSLWLTLLLRYGGEFSGDVWGRHFWAFTIIYAVWLVIFYINDLYSLHLAANNVQFYSRLSRALLAGAALAAVFFYFIPYFGITPKTNLFLNILILAALFPLWRQIYNVFLKSSALSQNILILGLTKESEELIQYLLNKPQLGYKLTAVCDPDGDQTVNISTPSFKGIKIFRGLESVRQVIISSGVQILISAKDPRLDPEILKTFYSLLPLKIKIVGLEQFYESIVGKIPLSLIGEIWFLENLFEGEKGIYEKAKRILDVCMAFCLGLTSLPLFPFIAAAVKLNSPGNVFYTQKRIGKGGQMFWLVKFRSMVQDAEKDGAKWAEKEDTRITKVGNFLRKSRLDELPQLWNVLKGEMSFIGPRPERPEFVRELEKQIPFYQTRHLIKPGLTGWAQINFPYGASVEDAMEKLQYDLYYIKHRSLVLDFGVVLKTIKIVLSRGGR